MRKLTVREETWIRKLFEAIRDANRALYPEEIVETLPKGFNKISLHVFLEILLERKLVFKSNRRIPTTNGGTAYLWAINQAQIEQRKEQVKENRRKQPLKYTKSRLMKQITEFLQSKDTGYTTGEISRELGKDANVCTVANTSWQLFKKGIIFRSPVKIPGKDMPIGNCAGFVYGRNTQAVLRGVERLMPEAVKSALIIIKNSTRVWSGWKLEEKTGISNENQNAWLKNRFGNLGIINYKIVNQVPYFWNPTLHQDLVDADIEDYIEKSREWRLKVTGLGRLFEEKAIYTFVKYLQAKGQDVQVSEEFPKDIPNWLNSKVRDQYKRIETDKNNYKRTIWLNDVWRFNSEPVDYVVFSRDPTLGHKYTYILSCKRDVSKKFGVNYFTSFVGCVKMGRTKRGLQIPDFLNATPVFICSDTYGKGIWAFNSDFKGQAGIILTLRKMQKMVEQTGFEFPEEYQFQELLQTKQAYEKCSRDRSVILGEKSVFELMKEKGFNVREDET